MHNIIDEWDIFFHLNNPFVPNPPLWLKTKTFLKTFHLLFGIKHSIWMHLIQHISFQNSEQQMKFFESCRYRQIIRRKKTLEFILFRIVITLTWSWGKRRFFFTVYFAFFPYFFCFSLHFAEATTTTTTVVCYLIKINWMSSSLRFNIALHNIL